jgi:hypothetical protein
LVANLEKVHRYISPHCLPYIPLAIEMLDIQYYYEVPQLRQEKRRIISRTRFPYLPQTPDGEISAALALPQTF